MAYGRAGKYTFWVKSGATERELTNYLFFHRTEKRLNQVSVFKTKLLGIPNNKQDVLIAGATFKILSQDNSGGSEVLILKGIIDSIEKSSLYEWNITGYGMEIKMQNKITGQSDFRYSTLTATSTIVTNLASTTGLTVGTNDNYGSIQIKFENENRLKALDKLAKSCVNATYNTVYNWYTSQGSTPYDTDYINFDDFRGSTTSTYTFDYGGTSSDLNAISKKIDKEHLVNAVTVLGFGDGTRQLISLAEDGDSITANGRQEKAFNEPTVNVQAQLDRLANSYLKRFKDPIITIYIKPSHPKLVLTGVSMGDKVTLNSDSSGTISGLPLDYRVVGMIIGTNEYGIEDLTLELSNQEIAFLDSISLSSDVTFESYQSAIVNDPGHIHDDGTYTGASHDHGAQNENPSVTGSAASHIHGLTSQDPSISGSTTSHGHNRTAQSPGTTSVNISTSSSSSTTSNVSLTTDWVSLISNWQGPSISSGDSFAVWNVEIFYTSGSRQIDIYGWDDTQHDYLFQLRNITLDTVVGTQFFLSGVVPWNASGHYFYITARLRSGTAILVNTKLLIRVYGAHSHTATSHIHGLEDQSPTLSGSAASHIHGATSQSPSLSANAASHIHNISAASPGVGGESGSKETGLTG